MLVCLTVLLLLASSGGLAGSAHQTGATVPDLQVGHPLQSEIASGQVRKYRVTLAAGDLVRIVAEQRGADVGLSLYRPDGTLLLGRNSETDILQPEILVVVADVSGTFALNVSSLRPGVPVGTFVVRLDDVHPATARDADVIGAYRAFERGQDVLFTRKLPDYPKAADAMTTARDAFRRLGDRAGELRCLLRLTAVAWDLRQPSLGDITTAAEQLATDLHDDVSRAFAIRFHAQAVERTGDVATALRMSEDALALYRVLRHEQGESQVLQDIGVEYGRTGDSDRALVRFKQALEIDLRWHDTPSQVVDLNDIGIAYKNVGEYDKALDAYQTVLRSPGLDLNPSVRAVALNNAGNLQQLLGHNQEALAFHLQALPLSRDNSNQETVARSLNTIGETYAALGQYDRALQYEQEGLAIRQSQADLSGQASSLTAIGDAETHLDHPDRAYASLSAGLEILRKIRGEYAEPDVLRKLAALDRQRGDLTAALDHAKSAVDLDEELRARITSPELRSTFVATAQDNYELYVDLLQQRAAADPSGGDAAAALEVSERARARVLLESLLDARVDLRQGIDPALLERERSLQKQLSTTSAQISRALSAPGVTAAPAALVNTYDGLTRDYQRELALIREQSPRYADMTHPRPLSAAEIQHTVLDDRTVLLEFELGADRSWLWAVTPAALTAIPLPPRHEIDAAVRALSEVLTARQPRAGETSAARAGRVAAADGELTAKTTALSHLLLGGVAGQLQGAWRDKRLAIVPTGSLEYVPFAALPLVSGHEIVRIPSASVLAALRTESAGRPKPTRTLAVLADPVFEASDPRVAAAQHPPQPAPPAAALEDLDESLYVRQGISRLPFSRDEARTIAALAGAANTFEATDFDASRSTVLGGALANYRIVHFATHGIVDSTRPALSGLVFSLVNRRGEHEDGFVRLPDIYNMRLGADLVVLSACQTALGKDIKGEGLIGLTRAFMYAGTPRVVASLWEVSDLATAELMKKFYTGMLVRHLAPAAALRAAQLEMAHDPRWAAPYYWAGFVFLGDWH